MLKIICALLFVLVGCSTFVNAKSIFGGETVVVTAYSPSIGQCDSTPFITASNTRVRKGIVALSRDLEKRYGLKFGDEIRLRGLGVYEFADRMHKRWRNKVDVFMWEKGKAVKFGKKTAIFHAVKKGRG